MAITAPKATLLCVDDEQSILKALQRVFASKDYQLLLANSGAQALQLMQQHQVHLIITDMRMPQMTGAEFLAQAATIQPDSYRILMTGFSDLSSTISAINIGKIHRYIQKPWDNSELSEAVHDGLNYFRLVRNNKLLTTKISQQNKHLKTLNHSLEEMVQQRTTQLKRTLLQLKLKVSELAKEQQALMEVLYNIISINPHLSGDFALSVASTCKELAKQLGLSQEESDFCYQAGLFSELGKLGMPVSLMQRPFSDLDNHERALYLQHPLMAEQILAPAAHLEKLTTILAQQYERFNGSGEPEQLIGTDIELPARILAVARDFGALIYQRATSKKHSVNEALDVLRRQRGTYYDPGVIDALLTLNQSLQTFTQKGLKDGLIAEELLPGMTLKQNLYNEKKVLLLPHGHVFTNHSINKIKQYQRRHRELLRMQIIQSPILLAQP